MDTIIRTGKKRPLRFETVPFLCHYTRKMVGGKGFEPLTLSV